MIAYRDDIYEEKPVSNNDRDELLTPQQAADYLAERWGRPMTAKDFTNMRFSAARRARAQGIPKELLFPIEPVHHSSRLTMWRRADLDTLIEKVEPPRLREEIRGKRNKDSKEKKAGH